MSTHPPEKTSPEGRTHPPTGRAGLSFRRYFTKPGRSPFEELVWETRPGNPFAVFGGLGSA